QPSPDTPPPPKKNESVVKPIETYQGDIEELVAKKNVSVVSIAAAEAARRDSTRAQKNFASSGWGSFIGKLFAIIGGVVLLSAAAGVLAYFFLRPAPSVEIATPQEAPFITVDQTRVLTVPQGPLLHTPVILALNDEKNKFELALG